MAGRYFHPKKFQKMNASYQQKIEEIIRERNLAEIEKIEVQN